MTWLTATADAMIVFRNKISSASSLASHIGLPLFAISARCAAPEIRKG